MSNRQTSKILHPELSNITHLDAHTDVFEKMLHGWDTQMLARDIKETSRRSALTLVRRFWDFTNAYPWQWTPEDFEAWSRATIKGGPESLSFSTVRGYQGSIRRFCDFITDPRYQWITLCRQRFGTEPQQICNEFNTYRHTDEFEGKPSRRALTYAKLNDFFNAADSLVARPRQHGRKGSLAAMRNSALFKHMYVFGPRCSETARGDVADLRPQPRIPRWGSYGSFHVRFGKSKRGGPPRRRTVLLVPEFAWAVEVLEQYIKEVRPLYEPGAFAGLWPTERRGRIKIRQIERAFEDIAREAGLDPVLEPHFLRHSFCTHLLEYAYPPIFVQRQMGHSWASNTALYGHVSNDFMNDEIQNAIDSRVTP